MSTAPNATTTPLDGPARDEAAVREALLGLARAADLRQWDALRAVFADQVDFDYGTPERITRDEILDRWRPALGGFDATQHVVRDAAVTLDGDRATATARFHATHVARGLGGGNGNGAAGDTWVLEGRYEYGLTRTADGWKVARIHMIPERSTGNAALPKAATARGELGTLHAGGVTRVAFENAGDTLVGRLHLPPTYAPGQKLPVVVVTGPWTTVKEQVAEPYAERLARAGFAALTFDFRGYGESGGAPREWENADRKVSDLTAAAEFVRALPVADGDRVGALAVCFGASYLARAVAEGARYASVATVAAWLHDPESLERTFGAEEVARRYAVGREARALFDRTGEVAYVPASSSTDKTAAMYQVDYYGTTARGLMPTYVNAFAVMSWPSWLGLDGPSYAPRITVPAAVIHSDGSALPQNARRFYETLGTPAAQKRLVWLTGRHTDFYDREPQVTEAAAAAAEHFARTLRAPASRP